MYAAYEGQLKETVKKMTTLTPTSYYHPMIFYQDNYYRFINDKCFIGTYARDDVHWSDKCCLSWFEYDISMDLLIKLEEKGTMIVRKQY